MCLKRYAYASTVCDCGGGDRGVLETRVAVCGSEYGSANSGALGTRKMNLWRVCIPVIADSHHFDEEQGSGSRSALK